MSKVVKRTFSLTEEQAAFIDAKVASGGYVSGSEVIREGLRGLQEEDDAIERWIREDVVPTLQRIDAGNEELIDLDEAFDEILQRWMRLRSDRHEPPSRSFPYGPDRPVQDWPLDRRSRRPTNRPGATFCGSRPDWPALRMPPGPDEPLTPMDRSCA